MHFLDPYQRPIDLPDDPITPHPDEASADVSSFRIGVRNALAITVGLVAAAVLLWQAAQFVRL